ncbi:Tubulin polyglutamylase ttll6 [Folsomia candida]|uniref:Tubulin polyglutamylase ttll6 n=1 Tax=Folsomia candida TaxID=158441 RepID=A0A226EXF3_FOLCA|nr:Tubulin polyglutamylase ttll6 [Folsomia candida]
MIKSKPILKIDNSNDDSKAEKKGLLVLGCRYDVILRVSMENNFTGVGETDCWSLCWSDIPLTNERINDMKRKQARVYLIVFEYSRNDLVHNSPECMKSVEKIVYAEISIGYNAYFHATTIFSQPPGIFQQSFVVTCVDPLRFYIHSDGIARFATVKYQMPSEQNLDVTYMHLTNYSLNKFSDAFDSNKSGGTKRPLSEIYRYMGDMGYDVQKLKNDIDDIVVKTIVGVAPTLRHTYRATFPKRNKGCYCFEILGFDILIDRHLKPMLVEVNHSPSFNLDTAVDSKVKFSLVRDLFAMIYLGEDSSEELWKSDPFTQKKYNIQRRPGTPHAATIPDALKTQFAHEEKYKNNFRLIFSEDNPGKYGIFMDKEYFLKDYEDEQFLKQRPEPCMHDGYSESFVKGTKTLTSFRQTQYGQVYVESRPASPYPLNHQEFLKFKFNSQLAAEAVQQQSKGTKGRSRKKKCVLENKKQSNGSAGIFNQTNYYDSLQKMTSKMTALGQPLLEAATTANNKLTPSQRVQIALEQLRKTNIEKFKAITRTSTSKHFGNTANTANGTDIAEMTSRPISPYLQSYSLLQEKLVPKSPKYCTSSVTYRPSSRAHKNDSVLFLDTSKLPSVFRNAMQATQRETLTRGKTADNEVFNDSCTSYSGPLNNPFKSHMEARIERIQRSNSRKRTIGVLGIGETAQHVVEMVATPLTD